MLPATAAKAESRLAPNNCLIWNDLVVLIDDGTSVPEDYEGLSEVAAELQAAYPEGFGLLVIIPPKAKPPSDDVRRLIRDWFRRLEGSLKCVCWLVEGKGFQASMARAVLNGLRFLPNRPFVAHVDTGLRSALVWTYHRLRNTDPQEQQDAVPPAEHYITSKRSSRHEPRGAACSKRRPSHPP